MAEDFRPVPDPTLLTTQQLVREIGALREVISARIDGIELLTEEKFKAAKIAVDSALQAATEAAGKSEAATEKQIDRIVALIEQRAVTTNIQINDLKDRFNRGEGHGAGIKDGWGWLVGAIGLIAGVVVALRR